MPRPQTHRKRHGRGATLRLQRNTFVICFRHPQRRDPKTGYGKVVRASLKTGDVTIASHYKEALDRIARNPAYWEHPPADTPERVREIWFGDRLDVQVESSHLASPVKVAPLPGQSRRIIEPSPGEFTRAAARRDPMSFHSDEPEGSGPSLVEEVRQAIQDYVEFGLEGTRFDYPDKDKAEAVAVAFSRLQDHLHFVDKTNLALNERIKLLEARAGDLERRNQLLQIRLGRHEKRQLKDARIGTLREEFPRWVGELDKSKFNRSWKSTKKSLLKHFVERMGPEKRADEISEGDVAAYVSSLTGTRGQRISEQTRKRVREIACAFMAFATHGDFNAKLVPTVKNNEILREARAIVWLTKAEVDRLIAKIPLGPKSGHYWRDVARIQASMGWRPSELLILQAGLATEKVVTLEPVRDPASGEVIGKTGGRSVRVPSTAVAAVRRRLEAGQELLFPRLVRERGRARKREGVLKEAWLEQTFCDHYREILRAAARKAGIKKPIDSRTFRRTFGSLQLRAGRKPHEVAELMGDRPETVKRHYARILAHEIDTEV